jgi:hypothetical protein
VLIRLFEGNPHTKYVHIEFSGDNVSQLIAISEGGILTTFLLKGYVVPSSLKSQYFDETKVVFEEDKPLLLIPFYNVNFNHFSTD